MKVFVSISVLGCVLLAGAAAQAQSLSALSGPDKYHITEAERDACGSDAVALCSMAYPDEDRLLACMKANRKLLSPTCSPVFDAGLRRRHMPL